jgi:hypothetical protein
MKFLIPTALLAMLVGGCSAGPPADAKTIKLEIQGKNGTTFGGQIRASDPGSAGISGKNFDLPIPGSIEFKGGPSEYTINLNQLPTGDKFVVSVDGKALIPGVDEVYEADRGRITFTIAETKKK